jgi:multidrug resistance efflux pump
VEEEVERVKVLFDQKEARLRSERDAARQQLAELRNDRDSLEEQVRYCKTNCSYSCSCSMVGFLSTALA